MLAGRRGLVVGVSGPDNLGGACARRLQALGAEVVVSCRPGRIEAVRAAGWDPLALDLDDEDGVAAAFADLQGRLGGLDFLVHSVVHVPEGLLARPLVELDRQSFETVLSLGAWSLVLLCRHAAPLLAAGNAPRVVAISSACGGRYTPRYHVAGIAKAALESTVLYLAGELGPLGIAVNAVRPPMIATPGAVAAVGEAAVEATRRHQARRSLTGLPVEADDVADVVAWMCSPMARHITGEAINVDGGFARAYL